MVYLLKMVIYVIFYSYVKLPEGKSWKIITKLLFFFHDNVKIYQSVRENRAIHGNSSYAED